MIRVSGAEDGSIFLHLCNLHFPNLNSFKFFFCEKIHFCEKQAWKRYLRKTRLSLYLNCALLIRAAYSRPAFLNRRVVGFVVYSIFVENRGKLALRQACKWWKSSGAGRKDFFIQKTGRGAFWVEKHCSRPTARRQYPFVKNKSLLWQPWKISTH